MKPKPVGIVIGLVGNFLFGWGLYKLMGIGSCGGEYPPCPSTAWPYFIAVPLGFIISFVGIFAGGGGFAFMGIFTTVGIASIVRGINGGVGPEQDETFAFVFGGIFLLPLILPLAFVPFARRKARLAERLVAEGKKGIGTVTAVHDTNVTINNNPRVRVELSIRPEDGGQAFTGEKAMVVSRVDIPRVGDRYPVWYDPQDPSKFGIGTGVDSTAPADVRALFAKATSPVPLPQPETTAPGTDWVTELGRLNSLRMSGALSDEEFARVKDRLLAGSPPAPAGG